MGNRLIAFLQVSEVRDGQHWSAVKHWIGLFEINLMFFKVGAPLVFVPLELDLHSPALV
jgi:hypothetical protein